MPTTSAPKKNELDPKTLQALSSLSQADLDEACARVRHFDFIKHCWQRPDPFIEATQTPFQKLTCEEIDKAIKDYKKGKSSYICVLVPSGHGKSDITSRYLPAHFLGEFPDSEVMVISHTDDKVSEFGDFGRTVMQSPEYRRLYPNVQLSKYNRGVTEWGIEGRLGKAQYVSLGSGSAGKRANVIIVDDFFGKREQAESAEQRDKVYQRIREDFMSRRAPVTIVVWVVTPWHVDDPIGRIQRAMKEDPSFPQFKFITFPAEDTKYQSGFLFPERFTKEWYSDQRKLLGVYGYESTMQCAPKSRGGRMFRIDKVRFYDKLDEIPHGNLWFKRAWDLASSVKQTEKSDPDFTAGVKGAVAYLPSAVKGEQIPILIIDDLIHGQWEATQRQTIIRDTAIADGTIEVGIEAFAAYKDAYTSLYDTLNGLRYVKKLQLPGDKKVKAEPLVPMFEAGNVFMKRAPWNDKMLLELEDFPNGNHDDIVDALACLFGMCTKSFGGFTAV